MVKNRLNLFYADQIVGTLFEDEQNRINFTYEDSWRRSKSAFSISRSMPLSETAYKKEAHNFFANLLPEGNIRLAIAGRKGISSENDFRLLEAIGGECAGAFTIGHEPQPVEYRYQEMKPSQLKKHFDQGETALSIVQNEDEEIRLSLAGAQDKIPVYFDGVKIFIPQGNSPSSHILKLPSLRFKSLPENEYIMGSFGKKMGLEMATPQLFDLGGINAYLIERYDRVVHDQKLIRLHQEDFCQAMAYSHRLKYEKDQGPTFKQCYDCTEEVSSALPEDLERLVKWLIFNVLVGNCDAHAKNLSLLMIHPGQWKLSPHYDVVSTRVYKKLSPNLAMSIGGTTDVGTITGSHWTRFAKQIKIGPKWVIQTVEEMAEKSLETFIEINEEFTERYGRHHISKELQKIVSTQQRRLLQQLRN